MLDIESEIKVQMSPSLSVVPLFSEDGNPSQQLIIGRKGNGEGKQSSEEPF